MTALPKASPEQPRPLLRLLSGGGAQVRQQPELPLEWPRSPHGAAAMQHPRVIEIAPDPGLPRPDPIVAHVAALLTEVLTGHRPATQLARWADPSIPAQLGRRVSRERHHPMHGQRVQYRSASFQVVHPRLIQATVVFRTQARARAVAFRLQPHRGRWVVTLVEVP